MWSDKYEVVIGLEVHAQLQTTSKLFCGDSTTFGAEQNSQVSVISLAHPGTLPVLNEQVVMLAIRLGTALNCKISGEHYFARKNYFYPDLPKGYQVSQHTHPICQGGQLAITVNKISKDIYLNRIHIEEDAGKSIHDGNAGFTSIDLNRAGVALLEIVTEPCIHSAEEAHEFLSSLRRLLRWLEVCDGNMEEGSLRCDANISLRLIGEKRLGTRVEIKNLNSLRYVKKAIDIEAVRLAARLDNNEVIVQETRGYDANTNSTISQRTKEEAEDYRYFPEPDLPLFTVTEEWTKQIRDKMPELPGALKLRLQESYGLGEYDASQVCSDKKEAEFFLALVNHTTHYKACANWIMGPVKSWCNNNETEINNFPLKMEILGNLIDITQAGKLSFANAGGKVLQELINTGSQDPLQIAGQLNVLQSGDDDSLLQWIDEVLAAMPGEVKLYKSGRKNLLGVFAGAVKKLSQGKADMKKVTTLLSQKLNTNA